MSKNGEKNGLAAAGLEGKSIVRVDDQKCETCINEAYGCKKLIASGGHVCIWD